MDLQHTAADSKLRANYQSVTVVCQKDLMLVISLAGTADSYGQIVGPIVGPVGYLFIHVFTE